MPNFRQFFLFFTVLALLYSAAAGLRTVSDPDLGWNLATGRYVVTHRTIPSHDVFSYTARSSEWIYPPFAGVLFYLFYLLGGYAALSVLSAAATAGTAVILLAGAERRAAVAFLALVAVPVIATRTAPRANLFTMVLFAGCLVILWSHFRGRNAPLWFLPVAMLAWVNLHLGFISGLALLAGYLLLEAGELPWPDRRALALRRLRRAAPWLAAALAATLINPWGPRIYTAIVRQQRIMEPTALFLGEWASVRITPLTLKQIFIWRSTDGAFWWLLIATLFAVIAAVWRKRPGPALFLLAAAFLGFYYVRFHGLFAMLAVVVAGAELSDVPVEARQLSRERVLRIVAVCLVAAGTVLCAVRCADLVSNRYYLSSSDVGRFGVGPVWWYPQRAVDFIRGQRLPANIFNDYVSGGFLTWSLPEYPDYIDGRSVPFGSELFFHQMELMRQSPGSAAWRREAGSRNINTLVFSNTRFPMIGKIPVKEYCESRIWIPVYLDEISAVFVRNQPENRSWTDRLALDCQKVQFKPPLAGSKADLYNFYANAASVLAALGRPKEAFGAFRQAETIFAGDSFLHLMRGSLLQEQNRPAEAEAEYRVALRLKETEEAWFALGQSLAQQQKFVEAAQALQTSIAYSGSPLTMQLALAQVYLASGRPAEALAVMDEADRRDPYRGAAGRGGARFHAEIAETRASAFWELGDGARALQWQEKAVAYEPYAPARCLRLAELYDRQGRRDEAERARQRAAASPEP